MVLAGDCSSGSVGNWEGTGGKQTLAEIDGIVLNKTVNKRKNLAFVLVLDKTSRFGLAD